MKMSRVESAMRAALDYYQALNQQNVERMLQLLDQTCVLEASAPGPDGAIYRGKHEIAAYWTEFLANAPAADFKIEEIFGLGRRCIVRWQARWLDSRDGGERGVRGVDIIREQDGKIVEVLNYTKC
jgi:ketosteroid isomerase-like protein